MTHPPYQHENSTGKSLLEALIFTTSTNPKYDKRLFIDLPVKYVKTTSSEHASFKTLYVHNIFRACSFHVLQ